MTTPPEGLFPLVLEPLVDVDTLRVGEVAVGLEHVEEVLPRGLRAPAGARLRAGEAVEGVVDLEGIKMRGVVRKLARG